MGNQSKPLAWLRGEVKTPPFSLEERIEVGVYSDNYKKVKRLVYHIRVLCQVSDLAATSYIFEIWIKIGGLFIELMKMRS